MDVQKQIKAYIDSQDEPKHNDLQTLHQHILQLLPKCKLWFLNGKDGIGKIVANHNIGYGLFNLHYKNGSTKEFYQIGISGNTTGILFYILGLEDKKYLPQTFGTTIVDGLKSLT